MEFSVLVNFELNETSKMQAKDASFVRRVPWVVVSNTGVFPQRYAHRHNLKGEHQRFILSSVEDSHECLQSTF